VAAVIADVISSMAAIEVIAALTDVSAPVVAVRMRETAAWSLRVQNAAD
jgi:hypothetical protein